MRARHWLGIRCTKSWRILPYVSAPTTLRVRRAIRGPRPSSAKHSARASRRSSRNRRRRAARRTRRTRSPHCSRPCSNDGKELAARIEVRMAGAFSHQVAGRSPQSKRTMLALRRSSPALVKSALRGKLTRWVDGRSLQPSGSRSSCRSSSSSSSQPTCSACLRRAIYEVTQHESIASAAVAKRSRSFVATSTGWA